MRVQVQRRSSGGLLGQTQSRADLDLLTEQRKALQEQAEQLSERRNVLFAQARNTPEGSASRRELESRMSEIDGRLATLDNQVAKLNDQISEAMGRVRAAPSIRTPSPAPVVVDIPRPQISIPPFEFGPRSRGPDMREVAGIMAAEAVVLALIGVAFWQFGLRRLRARFEQVERSVGDQSSQLNQLQQSVDVIGVEVERISEGQRYVAKVIGEGAPVARGLVREQPERQRG
jgi:cell division protein FtsB